MNMILHGDGHSGIQQINSLENPEYIRPTTNQTLKFDVVVTNLPFSQKIAKKIIKKGKIVRENQVAYLYYNGIAKNNGDATCILHCFQNLKEGGRIALVVPQGFLTRKDMASVRQFLLSKAKLQTVISLPQGTFLPYTGVKTSILYFTDAHKPNNQKEYWFYEAKNIGVTLDNKKRKITGINDLNKIDSSDINKVAKNPDLKTNMLELGFEIIDLEKVKNNNYNLVGTIYRKTIQNKTTTSFFDLLKDEFITGQKGKMITQNLAIKGDIPVIAAGRSSPYSHNQYNFNGNIITISSSGAYAGYVWYHNSPIWASDCSIVYSNNEELLLTKYLYYILKSQQNAIYKKQSGSGQPHVYLKDLDDLQIPLPSLAEQQKIVEELDRLQQSIEYTKGLISSMKNRGGEYWLDNKNIKSFYSLEEVCIINPKKPKFNENIEVSFIDMATLPVYGYKFFHSLIRPIAEVRKGYTYFEENDILIAKITPCFENGKCGIVTNLKNGIGFGSTEFIVLRPKKDILVEYLYIFMSSKHFTQEGRNFMTGTVGQQRISIDFIKNYKIPIISIEEQQKIIQEVEIEYNLLKEICNLLKKQEIKFNMILKNLFP